MNGSFVDPVISVDHKDMRFQPMLAENFAPMYAFFGAVWLVLSALCAAAWFAAYRGHWSALLLAGPAVLISGLTTMSLLQHPRGVLPVFWVTVPAPLLLGVPSVVLWLLRNRKRVNPTYARVILYVCLACALVLVLTIALTVR